MFRNITILVLSSIFLSGCFASSLTLVGTGASASQGRVVQSSISSAFNYGVKQTTGKYPIEHIIIKEKQRLAKKVNNLEKKILDSQLIQQRIVSGNPTTKPIQSFDSD